MCASPLQFLQSLVLLVDSSLLVSESAIASNNQIVFHRIALQQYLVPLLPRLVLLKALKFPSVLFFLRLSLLGRSRRRDDALKGAVRIHLANLDACTLARQVVADDRRAARRFAHKCAPGDRR